MGNFAGFQKIEDFYVHPRLGRIKRIQQENGPQQIQYRVLVQSEDVVEEWVQILQLLNSRNCQQMLFLPKNYSWQRIGFCGRNCQVVMIYDDYMFCLKDQIKNRRTIKVDFKQTSVWEILYKLVVIQNIMEKNKLRIGNVKPQNIIVNQDGDFRIISYFSYSGAQNTVLPGQQEVSNLYSPEQWIQIQNLGSLKQNQQLQLKKRNSAHQKAIQEGSSNVSQIFSIGATILQICSRQQSKQIYLKNGNINEELLSQRISSLENTYSKPLTSLIWQMMKIKPNKRIKAEELYQILAPYHQLILNHKQFKPEHRFCKNLQVQNHSFETNATLDSVVQRKGQKVKKKGWERFANFFPFMLSKTKSEIGVNHSFQKATTVGSKNQTI